MGVSTILPRQITLPITVPQNIGNNTVPVNSRLPIYQFRDPFAMVVKNSTPSTPSQAWEANGANQVTTPSTSTTPGNSNSNDIFLGDLNNFYAAARDAGYTYQRTDPGNTKGMDCCTGLWNFLEAYLDKEDFAKLAPLKSRAYNMLEDTTLTKEQRIRGFAGAIEDAGLGITQKVDKAFVDSLQNKSDDEIKNAFKGRIVTITGTNGDHVYVISDAWKDPRTGEIKYKMLGPHREGAQTEDGGNTGIGTRTKVYSLNDDIKPGANMHIATFNADVIDRANKNASGQSILAKVRGENTSAVA